jgi:hypothetical protein
VAEIIEITATATSNPGDLLITQVARGDTITLRLVEETIPPPGGAPPFPPQLRPILVFVSSDWENLAAGKITPPTGLPAPPPPLERVSPAEQRYLFNADAGPFRAPYDGRLLIKAPTGCVGNFKYVWNNQQGTGRDWAEMIGWSRPGPATIGEVRKGRNLRGYPGPVDYTTRFYALSMWPADLSTRLVIPGTCYPWGGKRMTVRAPVGATITVDFYYGAGFNREQVTSGVPFTVHNTSKLEIAASAGVPLIDWEIEAGG